MDEFPSLFQIACEPNSSISKNRADSTWNVIFGRNPQDWETEEGVNLFSRLEGQVMNVQEADKLRWGSDKDGKYSAKAGYANSYAPNEELDNWPWKLIWKTKTSNKDQMLQLDNLHETCLTQDNLKKRKFWVPTDVA